MPFIVGTELVCSNLFSRAAWAGQEIDRPTGYMRKRANIPAVAYVGRPVGRKAEELELTIFGTNPIKLAVGEQIINSNFAKKQQLVAAASLSLSLFFTR